MSTFVKICGITNLEDAKHAIDCGVDALGFNFYQKSKRYISPVDAQIIVRQLPASVWFVGIFVDSNEKEIEYIARLVGLDTLQFHGNESDEFCNKWISQQVIKAVRVDKNLDIDSILKSSLVSDYLLFDRLDREHFGGSGKEIEAMALEKLYQRNLFDKAILSGGLNIENLADRIEKYQPFGVDVASGVESSPGKKDPGVVKKFIEIAKK